MKLEMGSEFAKEQSERQMRLDRLYILDGRHHTDHAFHGLYSGLAAKAEELEKDLVE